MIACLGWGSLIWNSDGLPIEGEWQNDGPQLPVEFTRVSGQGRLSLVVTEGAQRVPVLWCLLSVASLDEAVQALAKREGCGRNAIGIWSAARSSGHPECLPVGAWACRRNLPAVIWTALKPGFPGNRGKPLTCQQALDHLRALNGAELLGAEEYIRRTPPQIRTPYRAGFERELGWTSA